MGAFKYPLEVVSTDGSRSLTVEAWVDTGAFYTWLPAPLLTGLGYTPSLRHQFKVADGRVIERGMGWVTVRLGGETAPTLCVFGDEGSEPLLGMYTLEGFRLAVDTVNRRLVPITVLPLLAL